MNNKLVIAALCFVFCIGLVAFMYLKLNTPENTAQKFYSWYVDCLNQPMGNRSQTSIRCKQNGPSDLFPFLSSPYVSKNLGEKLQKKEKSAKDTCTVNGACGHPDLVLCSLDVPMSVDAKKIEVKGDLAEVKLYTHYQSANSSEINISLQKEDNQWKIADITCPPLS